MRSLSFFLAALFIPFASARADEKPLAVTRDGNTVVVGGQVFAVDLGAETEPGQASKAADGTVSLTLSTKNHRSGFLLRNITADRITVTFLRKDGDESEDVSLDPKSTPKNSTFLPPPGATEGGVFTIKVSPKKK
jgi:hypothetical protein